MGLASLGQHQPGHEDQRHVEEYLRQKLVLVELAGIFVWWVASELAKVEGRCEKSERERPDTERHVETPVTGEALKSLGLLWFGSLAGWSWRNSFSGIFLATAPTVQWNDFLLADGRFAHRTRIPVAIHPLVYARPAKQMATHADDRVLGRVQAYVALEYRLVLLLFAVFGGVFEIDFGFPRRAAIVPRRLRLRLVCRGCLFGCASFGTG